MSSYDTPALSNATKKQFEIPTDAGKRIALVKELTEPFRANNKTLIWITDWGGWPSSERQHIFYRLRAPYSCDALLVDQQGQVFGREEFEDMVSCVTLGVTFLWDVCVLTPLNTRTLFFSHDEYGLSL
ncbi:MAG: hypothetical protein KBA75_09545 [Alphaproteobacteria bacterium]|nr:hypothetical protein [Alphaproteobacteria bacterium]